MSPARCASGARRAGRAGEDAGAGLSDRNRQAQEGQSGAEYPRCAAAGAPRCFAEIAGPTFHPRRTALRPRRRTLWRPRWPRLADNWRRFAALSQVGADIAAGAVEGYVPDIVHAHDWQAAMTLAYMRYGKAAGTPSVMTVQLRLQGQFGAVLKSSACRAMPCRSTASNITAASAT